jgi:segregation and condensation protein B
MTEPRIKNVIEAALLAAGRPLQVAEIAELFDESMRPETKAIREALASLEQDYTDRGIEIKETANGFRIQVRRDLANEISRLWPERPPRYSRALLETLALIAYRQPITRAEIEAVRGVAVNPNIIKTVIERNWVRVVGQRDVPGRPELLGTTKDFLDYFGLRSLDDLPPLAELKAMGDVNLQLDLAKESADVAAAGAPIAEQASGEGGAAAIAGANADGAPADIDADADGRARAAAGDVSAGDPVEAEAASGSDRRLAENDARAAKAELGRGIEAGDTETQSDRGPEARAARAFVAEIDDDGDALANDDDSSDDELSAADPNDSGELVAAPPRYDD